jgi:hypothetical protein
MSIYTILKHYAFLHVFAENARVERQSTAEPELYFDAK